MDVYEKSEEILKKIIKSQKKLGFEIILVGGWGVYCFNPYLKSKDIDLLIRKKDFWKLEKFLDSLGFRETGKVLEKRGFAMLIGEDKIEIDVYDEKIGNFDVNEIFDKNMFVVKKFLNNKVKVADLSLLLALKIQAGSERIGTGKGMKDISDILALLEKFKNRIDLKWVKSCDPEKFKNVLPIVFSDYRKIKNLYPISFLNFHKLKQHVLKYF